MKKIYRIYYHYQDYLHTLNDISFIDTKFLSNEKFLKDNNLSDEYIQSILNKSMSFYYYKINNKKIFDEIKQQLFHKIITGELTVSCFKSKLSFISNDCFYTSTLALYRDKILSLKEVKNFHNIFSKYKEKIDYVATEELCFNNYKTCDDIIKRIKSDNTNYYIQDINVLQLFL